MGVFFVEDSGTIHVWVVVSNIFYFHPYLGKIPSLANIFQRGRNHQLDVEISLPSLIWKHQSHDTKVLASRSFSKVPTRTLKILGSCPCKMGRPCETEAENLNPETKSIF